MGMKVKMRETAVIQPDSQSYVFNERSARADRLIEKWSKVPEIGSGLKAMSESKARNTAILLENQVHYLSKLTETQYSNAFSATPENMIRLVRLAYPNSIRDKLFTEFAMETAKDSIKYIKPVYTAASGAYAGAADRNHTDGFTFNSTKVTYEDTEDKFPTEMARGVIADAAADVTITFADTEWGTNGANLIDGYGVIYDTNGDVMAMQNRSGTWVVNTGSLCDFVAGDITGPVNGVYTVANSVHTLYGKAFARYNSEVDLTGTYLGEIELVMTDYQFKVRPITLGVTWTTLSELVLDSTVGVSTEETLMDAAGQEIKKALDFRAVRIALEAAATNGYATVEFDAEAGAGTDDSYIATAQTISQAVMQVGNVIYNNIKRGGVSRIVGGPAAVTYLMLNAGWSNKGAQPRIGGYQVGMLNDIPVFMVPNDVIDDDILLCVWKNENNEADVSVAFGTLVPFFSTGSLQRKNFYKEAGLASYGDYQVLNQKYFGKIQIKNIRGV